MLKIKIAHRLILLSRILEDLRRRQRSIMDLPNSQKMNVFKRQPIDPKKKVYNPTEKQNK